MGLIVHDVRVAPLTTKESAAWRAVPTAIISDELNRFQTMDAGIVPIGRAAEPVVGPALTVRAMAADNLAIHHAVARATPGVVLVIDAAGYDRNAIWGGILQRAAELRGINGVIVDGCVRDAAELMASPLPCYARGVVPAGPHKGWGGEVNATISAGGCTIAPADLIVADADGVAIVPAGQMNEVLSRCRDRVASEKKVLSRLEAGETTVEIFDL